MFSEMLGNGDTVEVNVVDQGCGLELGSDSSENMNQLQTDKTERQARDDSLRDSGRQTLKALKLRLERVHHWKTRGPWK